jgi:hypothetical protein
VLQPRSLQVADDTRGLREANPVGRDKPGLHRGAAVARLALGVGDELHEPGRRPACLARRGALLLGGRGQLPEESLGRPAVGEEGTLRRDASKEIVGPERSAAAPSGVRGRGGTASEGYSSPQERDQSSHLGASALGSYGDGPTVSGGAPDLEVEALAIVRAERLIAGTVQRGAPAAGQFDRLAVAGQVASLAVGQRYWYNTVSPLGQSRLVGRYLILSGLGTSRTEGEPRWDFPGDGERRLLATARAGGTLTAAHSGI